MATHQRVQQWNEGYETARARLAAAKLRVKRTEDALAEARLNHDRADGLFRRIGGMGGEAQGRAQMARVKLDEAKKNSQDARRRGLPRHRWEADTRKWEAVAEDALADSRRWEDDANRAGKDIKEKAREIQERQTGLVKLEREVVAWEREAARRSAIGQGLTTTGRSAAGVASKLLEVTAQATEALKSVLESTNRDSDQSFRLTAGEGGGIALALDVQREGDNVVSH